MKKYFLFLVISSLLIPSLSFACSDFLLKAKDNTVVVGRSMEFPIDLKSSICVFPRGQHYTSINEKKVKGISWTTKYGFIGVSAFGQPSMICDGFNEKGLSFDGLMFTGAVYEPANPGKFVTILDFPAWLLGNFSTVDEVKNAVTTLNIANMKNKYFKDGLGMHVAVHDAKGNNLVIEFINGKKKIYDNPIGVMTNRPEFPAQITNLRNYVNLDAKDKTHRKINGVDIESTGVGSGMIGLPGDWTPPSRFTKIAFCVDSALKPANSVEAAVLAEHVLNAVDIPKGVIKENPFPFVTLYGYAQWSIVKDLTNLVLYYRTYENPSHRMVDLKRFNLEPGSGIKSYPINAEKASALDVTSKFR